MKILIVTQYYFPEQFQINEIAPELVRRGHEVTVLCGVPNYPKGIVFQGYETFLAFWILIFLNRISNKYKWTNK